MPEHAERLTALRFVVGGADSAVEMPAALQRYRPMVLREMQAVLDGRTLPIYEMLRYHLGWQEADGSPRDQSAGKGMRPALCLLAADALEGTEAAQHRALAGAAAVEFVHNYSLVHDDIQDGDRERHHRPTVWVQWGKAQGINVGDALRELAQFALQRAGLAGTPAASVIAALDALSAAGLEMIEGQYLDLTFEERTEVTLADYLDMIERKTGAMMGCSLQLGGLLASGDPNLAARLRVAGRRLGLLFQIRDDYLGIWGDSAMTGKSSDNDIRRRKKSFPVVYTFAAAGQPERERLRRTYRQSELSDDDVQAVLAVMNSVDAAAATTQAAHKEYQAFVSELDGCGLSPEGQREFGAVADFLLQREH